MLDNVRVCLIFIFKLIMLKPWVALEAHQPTSVLHLHEQHHVTVGFFILVEAFLFDHLSVVDEANELPLTQVDNLLWHILSQMNDYYLVILRRI